MAKKKKVTAKKAKAVAKKGGRDFRGIDRKTGKKDSGPGPSRIQRAMGATTAPSSGC